MAVKACAKGGQWERALSLMVERRVLDAREAKEAAETSGTLTAVGCRVARASFRRLSLPGNFRDFFRRKTASKKKR